MNVEGTINEEETRRLFHNDDCVAIEMLKCMIPKFVAIVFQIDITSHRYQMFDDSMFNEAVCLSIFILF